MLGSLKFLEAYTNINDLGKKKPSNLGEENYQIKVDMFKQILTKYGNIPISQL